ncbi:hypothetical protein FBU30_004297 [Linnemannia zychae]|nr:hypothetical protein FBU30_004297 [Linnemannia zychae]
MKVSTRPVSFLSLTIATTLTLFSFSLSSSSYSSSAISGVYAAPVRSSQVPTHQLHSSSAIPQSSSTQKHIQQQQQQKQHRSKNISNNKSRKDKKNPNPLLKSHPKKIKSTNQQQKKRPLLAKADAAVAAKKEKKALTPPPPSRAQLTRNSTSPTTSTSTPPRPIPLHDFDKPILIVPPPRSVWHAGSVQQVKWSKKYARHLPKDTTVDIVLADARSNKKIFSLKRFIPFRKGSAQVWVPSKFPDNENASYVLVLEFFHGRSQKPITVESAKAASIAPAVTTASSSISSKTTALETEVHEIIPPTAGVAGPGGTVSSKKSVPSILRRSDINIYKRAFPSSISASAVSTPASSSKRRENYRIAADSGDARADALSRQPYYSDHHRNDDSEFNNNNVVTTPFYDNFDHYLRQEFPNIIQPIELEHTFGVHQKVYSRAPYTLKWKVPERATELLDYTSTRLRLLATKDIDWSQHQALRDNNVIYQAKLLVQLVRDESPLESIAVLARNVPAETKFQYLQIQDHVEPAFYRLRVQMLVVEIDDTPAGQQRRMLAATKGDGEDPMLDGWDFAKGAQIIDRYESITRKFWVAAGAL